MHWYRMHTDIHHHVPIARMRHAHVCRQHFNLQTILSTTNLDTDMDTPTCCTSDDTEEKSDL